jgi:pyocin large subunit-like protein
MLQYTKGFPSRHERRRHFERHRHEFKFANEFEYELAADKFLGTPKTPTTQECTVQRGERAGRVVRYDSSSDLFGVLAPDGLILTFFKPSSIFTTPAEYFKRQCQ